MVMITLVDPMLIQELMISCVLWGYNTKIMEDTKNMGDTTNRILLLWDMDMVLKPILVIQAVPLGVGGTYHQYDNLRDPLVPVLGGIMIVLVGGTGIHQIALPQVMEEGIVTMIWGVIMMDHQVVALNIEDLDFIIIQIPPTIPITKPIIRSIEPVKSKCTFRLCFNFIWGLSFLVSTQCIQSSTE